MTARPLVHLALHALAPAVAARLGWRARPLRAWLVMMATMAVDLDHLLARPVYVADRCSIGSHPLHGPWAIGVYAALLIFARTRVVGVGLCLHIALDALDCVWMA